MVYVKFEEDEERMHMSAEECTRRIKNLVKLAQDQKVRMSTNPFNRGVIRVDTICGDEGRLMMWVERVTPKKEAIILAAADEVTSGRFW